MRKRVALFIGAIAMDNQQRVLNGILKEAKKHDILCYIFTCFVSYQSGEESQRGNYNIMKLPDLKSFDGVIFWENTIQYMPMASELEKRIRMSGIKAVSIDDELPNKSCVLFKNYEPQYDVIRHVIKEHGAKKLLYISGYRGSPDGEIRYQAFLDACDEFGIAEKNRTVAWGDFSFGSGRISIEDYVSKNNALPDAVICANDQMAVGTIEALKDMGYRVPEDVIVTGFDGDSFADAYHPKITTVRKNHERLGEIAMQLLQEDSSKGYRTEWVDGTLDIGDSCGCTANTGRSTDEILEEFVSRSIIEQQSRDIMREMSSEFAEIDTLDDFYSSLKKYLFIGDMTSCYLCMCSEDKLFSFDSKNSNRIDLQNINTEYTPYVSMPTGNMKGREVSYGRFKSGMVLPEEIEKKDNADFYVVAPLSFHDCCYGYIVTADSQFSVKSEMFYSWINNTGVGLENVRKKVILNQMVDKLNEMWVYDTMTKLYNRAGFYNLAGEQLDNLKSRDENVFLMFIDLDGLKKVNDTLGHEMGDSYISSMGDVLRSVKKVGDMAMRYGGDEFVLFGGCKDYKEAAKVVGLIEAGMKEKTFCDGKFTLQASIGLSVYRAREIDSLDKIIREADVKMYELKKNKKRR